MNFSQEGGMITYTSITLARVFSEYREKALKATVRDLFSLNERSGMSKVCTVIGAYHMIYSEYKEMCPKACSEKANFLYIDITRDSKDG